MTGITVLMPVYNDAKYLKHSVKSILNQTYRDFEFLIVDDGSEDNTEEIISDFRDSRIIYKKTEHKGLASALNYGIANSSGDWIARIDADDLNTSERLKTQMNFLRKNQEYNVISSWSVYFQTPHKILFLLKTSDTDLKKSLNLHNPINHSSVMFDKKIISGNGGYNETFRCYEDFELWFRLRDKLNFKIIPEYLVFTRLRKDSMTQTEKKDNLFRMLSHNAELNLDKSLSSEDQNYWYNILFWIEFFYGNRDRAGKYLSKNFSLKKAAAFLNTFLPDKAFKKIIDLRLRYRLESKFINKAELEKELKTLLT